MNRPPEADGRGAELRLLAFWLLALLLGTVWLKIDWLDNAYHRDGFIVILHALTPGGIVPDRVWAILFFAIDALEVALWVAVLYGIFCRALRLPLPLVVLVANLMTLLTAAANHVSLNELGTLLTTDSLVTAVRWIMSQPALVSEYASAGTAVLVLQGLAWALAPLLAWWLVERLHRATGWAHALAPAAAVCVGLAAVAWVGAQLLFPGSPLPLRGYWSSSARTFVTFATDLSEMREPLPDAELLLRWRELTYPHGRPPQPRLLVQPRAPQRPPYVLVISLETAPLRFYPLTRDASLPTFHALSQRSIVSERHWSNTPFTSEANFTILTGVYPSREAKAGRRGFHARDGVAAVLARRGYETTFIDTMQVDWHPAQGNRETVRGLGFENVLDQPDYRADAGFERILAREEASFARALQAIEAAVSRGRPAFVYIDTILGHYPWQAPEALRDAPPERKLHGLALEFDRLVASVLGAFERLGIGEDFILVVTGDHGLRYALEFESVGIERGRLDAAFNVPLLVHAPGVLPARRIELPWVTSHVDLTPTLLALAGIDTSGMLHHGESLLDGRVEQRVVFMLNGQLSPEDTFLWRGSFVRRHSLTGRTRIATRPDELDAGPFDPEILPASLRDPADVLARAYRLMLQTETSQVHHAGTALSPRRPPERSSPARPLRAASPDPGAS